MKKYRLYAPQVVSYTGWKARWHVVSHVAHWLDRSWTVAFPTIRVKRAWNDFTHRMWRVSVEGRALSLTPKDRRVLLWVHTHFVACGKVLLDHDSWATWTGLLA